MRRRDFIGISAGLLTALSSKAQSQSVARARSIAMLLAFPEADREGQLYFAAFQQELKRRGWSIGRDLHIDVRWGGVEPRASLAFANELIKMKPDLIVAHATVNTRAIVRQVQGIPVVF